MGLCLAGLAPVAAADGLDAFKHAASAGTPNLDARLRYEGVDQDNALTNAHALTLRSRLGYTTGKWNGLDAQLEYEGTVYIGDELYNNNRPGGKTGYSVVADPAGSELNQAWVRYAGIPGVVLKLGRQRMVFDNARFVGNVGWRQNEQTYEGALITTTLVPRTTISYAFISDVNTPVFLDWRMHAHLANVAFAPLPALTVTAYGYLLDFNAQATTPPGSLNPPAREDTQTLGVRASGSVPLGAAKLGYALEYADQGDYADSAVGGPNYYLVEVSGGIPLITGKLAYEVLGGDGVNSFQTPLATLHAFQGWADQFLVTPRNGIRDLNATLTGTVARVALLARWHDFKSDEGSIDYGTEVDLQATWPVNDRLSVGAKYADFNAATTPPFVDTRKSWAWAEYRF
ncbi:MAG TPA: alginate export family protein [Solimonas sp.]|nr:alginate export family protein [Solimonas sp.]